jgi:hypothetical protein
MFNILKKKTIEVFCYTDLKIVNDLFKIQKSNHFYPDWWKNLPKYQCPYSSQLSMKGCYGFLEYHKQSFTMPLWSDLVFYTKEDGHVDINSSMYLNVIRNDKKEHLGFFNTEKFELIKLQTPWVFYCKEKINFYTSGTFFDNFETLQNIQIVPGVTNYYVNQSNNIFFIVKKNQLPVFIKNGTPLRHFFPLTEKKVVFICEYNEKKYLEILKDTNLKISFFNNIYTKIKLYNKFK